MTTLRSLIICLFSFLPALSSAIDESKLEVFSESIVQTIAVVGGKNVYGTGFFIDRSGFILTAGHNVLPKMGALGGSVIPSSDVRVILYQPDGNPSSTKEVPAVVVYADHQTDLALLRANVNSRPPLNLAPPEVLKEHSEVGIMTWRADELGGAGRPVYRPVSIDSLFNPNEFHAGLIDLSGRDLGASSSGGPLIDEYGFVAGVFTKGRSNDGEAAVPISYAFTLLNMAGVAYPSDEVREVINELRRDLYNWKIDYQSANGAVVISYNKRLAAGPSPVKFFVEFRVYTKRDIFAFPKSLEHTVEKIEGQKKGKVILANVGDEIDDEIDNRNQHAKSEGGSQEKLKVKEYAEVIIMVEYADNPGIKFTEVTGLHMDFNE